MGDLMEIRHDAKIWGWMPAHHGSMFGTDAAAAAANIQTLVLSAHQRPPLSMNILFVTQEPKKYFTQKTFTFI